MDGRRTVDGGMWRSTVEGKLDRRRVSSFLSRVVDPFFSMSLNTIFVF